TEPESLFDIMADGNRIGGFTVKQAKKAGFAASTSTVNVTNVIGGVQSRPSLKGGSFVASEWDVANVTSSNASLPVSSVDLAAGTFSVEFAATLTYNSATQNATITLNGADGISRGSYTTSQSKVVYTLPTGVLLNAIADTTVVTVASSNAGPISSGMTATSGNTSWCKVSVDGDKVIVTATANTATASRSTSVYVTYLDSRSQNFTVTQMVTDPTTIYIGGAYWKKYNVNSVGNLATALPSECTGVRTNSLGRLYQWGRNVAWGSDVSSASGWNTSTNTDSNSEWPSNTNPCPSGFRVPTDIEYQNLANACIVEFYNNGSDWANNNYGYITLVSKTNSKLKLEFPAVGRRAYWDGGRTNYGTNGFYWTSVGDKVNTVNAHDIGFNSGGITTAGNDNKRNGFSVRCVRQ
ncbi:MAG: fibrobacter succinogenes major paralogous domain-containing protein, partial [Rikenellaceae bacterium]|nr:fibrobacter succinogenes major paralogous domain-containing protein [Rikenellaceae bacterium]